MAKTYDKCISDILSAISRRKMIDFMNQAEITHQSKLTASVHKNIHFIEEYYPKAIELLLELTYSTNPDVVYGIGCNLMYLDSISTTDKELLLARLQDSVNEVSFLSRSDVAAFQFAVLNWERMIHKHGETTT